MKTTKKLFTVLLAVIMVLALNVTAFAQTEGTAAANKGSITITNPAKGETYGVVKIFDAVEGQNGAIIYTGTIPAALQSVFETNTAGNIVVKNGVTDAAVLAAVQTYAANQTATASAVANGDSTLVFQGLDYGYYAVKSTQGANVTITSTNPNATVNDKNTTEITAEKTAEAASYSIGDTVNYTATFDTVTYVDDKQVVKYTISDTLPEFLSNVTVTSIIIDEDGDLTTTNDQTTVNKQFTNKQIEIDWANEVAGSDPKTYTSLHNNGAKIVIEYQGTLTSVTNINAADTNTVSIQPSVWNPTSTTVENPPEPSSKPWSDSAEITTYAAALKKVDGEGNALAGAAFTVPGLVVEQVSAGVYRVVSYDSTGATAGTPMSTDANGKLYILGLASGTSMTATETTTPAGYNTATGTITIVAQELQTTVIESNGTRYYDADGNLVSESSATTTTTNVTRNLEDLDAAATSVVNQKGGELPSTGGIGTTLFYVLGGILLIGAAVILISRKRAESSKKSTED